MGKHISGIMMVQAINAAMSDTNVYARNAYERRIDIIEGYDRPSCERIILAVCGYSDGMIGFAPGAPDGNGERKITQYFPCTAEGAAAIVDAVREMIKQGEGA